MRSRRLEGVVVLAIAVLVLSVGTALARPDVVGVADAPPIDPPPAVGDCLYGGPDGPWGVPEPDGTFRENPYAHWFSHCTEPWYGQVVSVRSGAEISAGLAPSAYHPGPADPCAAGVATFLGRPDYLDPAGQWEPFGPWTEIMTPNRRQRADRQSWETCVMPPPVWNADGDLVLHSADRPVPRTSTSLRGAWADAGVRNQLGFCRDGAGGPDSLPVFCGVPHGSEVLARASWPDSSWGSGPVARPDAATLLDTCAAQAARMVQRPDATAAGALTVEVWLADGGGYLDIAPGVVLPDDGTAECSVRPTATDRQLTGTLVGTGDGPVPLTAG